MTPSMHHLAALALILGLTGCAAGGPDAAVESGGTTYKLYFLGGQSNMEGYGYTGELPGSASFGTPRAMVFVGQAALDNDVAGGVGVWHALQPGFGTGFRTDGVSNTLSDRFGPELYFGQTMAERHPGAHIAIVKYAMGGTGLADGVGYGNWHPDFSDGQGVNQYDHALRTLRNALSAPDIDGDGVADRLVPSGIVWMQGEADAFDSQASADAYRANLERLMGLLRAALRVDDLPVVVGKVTDSGMADDGTVMDFVGTVQDAQREFVSGDDCAALVTATDSLGYLDDGWHYDTEGFVRLGEAFAEAMSGLEQGCGRAGDPF
jgi:hypothetical protein